LEGPLEEGKEKHKLERTRGFGKEQKNPLLSIKINGVGEILAEKK